MPELPEVETIRIGLDKLLPGRTISSVWFDWKKSFPNSSDIVDKYLIGSRVMEIKRRAKVLIIDLNSKYSLVIHLKMTGQIVFVQKTETESEERFRGGHPNNSLIGQLPDKSTRVIIGFDDGSNLYFNDQRKFGWMLLLPTLEIPNIEFFRRVGPEPLSKEFTADKFSSRMLLRPGSGVKSVLLDQTIVAGLGNIYADESLWYAMIHPSTLVKLLSENEVNKLFTSIVQVLNSSIKSGGSTDRNYVDAQGNKGNYLASARVFRREGQACYRCNSIIIKLRVAGRGTHVCPRCQKVKK